MLSKLKHPGIIIPLFVIFVAVGFLCIKRFIIKQPIRTEINPHDTLRAKLDTMGRGAIPYDSAKMEKIHLFVSQQARAKNEKSITQPSNLSIINTQEIPPFFTMALPPVGNQGGEGSCVAFAEAYYALSIEWYHKTGATNFSTATNIFSPEYIFDQITSDQYCSGSSVLTGLDFLKANGCVLWNTLPYTSTGCQHIPTAPEITEAAIYKIGDYSRVLTSDIVAIKSLILQGHPIIAQMYVDDNYRYGDGTSNYIWKTIGANAGIHANDIVGWDDSKHAYLFLNQYGESFGDGGFRWVDYDFAVSTVLPSNVLFISSWPGVTPPPPTLPVINSFSANPSTINIGQSSSLTWSTTGATTLSINGVVVVGTSLSVSPTATTNYILTASNTAGSVTAQTTVTVNPIVPPPSETIILSGDSIGKTRHLSWQVINPSGTIQTKLQQFSKNQWKTIQIGGTSYNYTQQGGKTIQWRVIDRTIISNTVQL